MLDILDTMGCVALEADDERDLLVSDVGLPGGMNGPQLADAARLVRPELKVLFIAGYAEQAVLDGGRLASGMQVMTKPFTMSAIAARIKAIPMEA